MYQCQITGEQSQLADKEIRIVIERRDAEYFDDRSDPKKVTGYGREIARERRVTMNGLREWVKAHPEDYENVRVLREKEEFIERRRAAEEKRLAEASQ